jgi:hypothetical protein
MATIGRIVIIPGGAHGIDQGAQVVPHIISATYMEGGLRGPAFSKGHRVLEQGVGPGLQRFWIVVEVYDAYVYNSVINS